MPISIQSVAAVDSARALDVLVLAFSADPVARWSWLDAHTYVEHFAHFARAFGGEAFAHASAYAAADYAGAALWLPPGVNPDEATLMALVESTTPAHLRGDVFGLLEAMGGFHPSEPHWYLPLIGVDPARQGQGIGAALMQHALMSCDRDGAPAYLESTNPRNVSLYERHGFEVLGTIQVGSSPPLTPMLRKPRPPKR